VQHIRGFTGVAALYKLTFHLYLLTFTYLTLSYASWRHAFCEILTTKWTQRIRDFWAYINSLSTSLAYLLINCLLLLLLQEYEALFYETSAKSGHNIDASITEMTRQETYSNFSLLSSFYDLFFFRRWGCYCILPSLSKIDNSKNCERFYMEELVMAQRWIG